MVGEADLAEVVAQILAVHLKGVLEALTEEVVVAPLNQPILLVQMVVLVLCVLFGLVVQDRSHLQTLAYLD
jgi:hypothetical protein